MLNRMVISMKTIFRMIVSSDLHYKPENETEPKRFEHGLQLAYAYAEAQPYTAIDALFIVGDFADRGRDSEMLRLKETIDGFVQPETTPVLMMASHEFMRPDGGEASALESFARIFGQAPDQHNVFNGLHCISLTTQAGCRIKDAKKAWLTEQLKAAAADDPEKPIFVFQHPHLTDTVYGSIDWGEDDIIQILMDYPQVVDFSGHSHAPVNDPRSACQKFFTSFGTGSMSYFELDEFDFSDGTIPFAHDQCAQFLIVEVFDDNSVLVKPFDILSEHFFHDGYYISCPSDPDTFTYTDARYAKATPPVFPDGTELTVTADKDSVIIQVPQAQNGIERVDSYSLIVRSLPDRHVVRQMKMPSGYYLYQQPASIPFRLQLPAGEYEAAVYANGFFKTVSSPLRAMFSVK